MKWFKHDANASLDAKLQRLRLKYGMEGYGLYWFCLESIARNVESHNLTFELEEDAELISAATNIHYERVQEMMTYMCDLALFENAEGQITCLKMATRADEYTQKILRSREKSGQAPDKLRIVSGQSPDKVPPIRIEEKRREEKKTSRFAPPSVSEVTDYCSARSNSIDPSEFVDHYTANGWMRGKSKIKDWKACVRTWEKNKKNKSQEVEDYAI